MRTPTPPRLHGLLARHSPLAVVIRRGPAKQVCTVLWNRNNDTFTLGQWLRGRIYAYRSDISPDGRHLIYFAMNGRWSSKVRGSWTAISRAPYLKAIGLYSKGDCWHGGGIFLSKGEFWLNDGYGHVELTKPHELARASSFADAYRWGGECPGVYFPRLLRDGWRLIGTESGKGRSADTFERPARGKWTLRKVFHAGSNHAPGKGVYVESHALVQAEGAVLDFPDWEWAEMDGTRLVWATGGCLFAAKLNEQGLVDQTLLHDFAGMAFQQVEAPY